MKKIFFILFCATSLLAQRQLYLIKYDANVIAKFIEQDGTIYKIGLGIENTTKTDAELTALAEQKYNDLKTQQAAPIVLTTKEILNEAYLKELGTVEDQLEMIYNDMLNGTTIWLDKRTEIKNRVLNK